MRIFDLIDIILIVVIILCDFFLYAFFLGCRIAYKKGLDDGRENSWRKQPLRDIDKKREARKMNIKQKIKDLQCKCFGHKPIVEVYAMRVHGKKRKKYHVVRETKCMRCGENIKFEMTDLKSRAELLQEGWFIEDK